MRGGKGGGEGGERGWCDDSGCYREDVMWYEKGCGEARYGGC